MEYRFKCEVTAMDFWKLVMRRTYRSMAGVCNLVFTVAMVVLAFRFWNTTTDLYKSLILSGCLLFPVIQPVLVYGQARRQVASLPKGMELGFDDRGIHVDTQEAVSVIPWNQVKNIVQEFHMIIIFSDSAHGYILTDRILGEMKKPFYEYIVSRAKIKK